MSAYDPLPHLQDEIRLLQRCVSQGRPVQYFAGNLDSKTMRFTSQKRGVMDFGNYYAPNCMLDPKGRRILWGVVSYLAGMAIALVRPGWALFVFAAIPFLYIRRGRIDRHWIEAGRGRTEAKG